ncbi:hypothetical protein EJ06DRAFT_97888 [Trichodelitschia bisporula]|uniref:Methyltransferase type 12 domain-containing protein n=1 Tax=Trichodelitschia bisporula TaxID=703511 RepID=A0A6G1HR19_9PEZI|nr:hypothetical protein EJ06DRAFT_97888 [Trichodelitschia bisporula]
MTQDDPYLIGRSRQETERLNRQHQFYHKTIGYLLHPSITSHLATVPNPRIADVATGTGIFLREVAKSLPPTAQFDGFDISPDQFPAPETVPKNMRFHVVNAKQPFPAEFIGKFHVVHLRLLVCAMCSVEDWTTVARNVIALLKPGGAIQWTEGHFRAMLPVLRSSPVPAGTSALDTFMGLWINAPEMKDKMPLDISKAFGCLLRVFKELGLKSVMRDVVPSDRLGEWGRKEGTEVELALFGSGMSREEEKLLKGMGLGDEEVQLWKEVYPKAVQEKEEGAYVMFPIHVTFGFKPSR